MEKHSCKAVRIQKRGISRVIQVSYDGTTWEAPPDVDDCILELGDLFGPSKTFECSESRGIDRREAFKREYEGTWEVEKPNSKARAKQYGMSGLNVSKKIMRMDFSEMETRALALSYFRLCRERGKCYQEELAETHDCPYYRQDISGWNNCSYKDLKEGCRWEERDI